MTEGCPKPLDLVSYFHDGGKLESHARGCEACSAQLRELEAERKAFLVSHPFSAFMADLEKRRPQKASGGFLKSIFSSGAFRAAVAMAGVATLMIVVIGRYERTPEILSKGAVDLRFYVSEAAGKQPAPGKNGMTLPADSALQFVYSTTSEDPKILLVGVEADGNLSVYFPSGGDQSVDVPVGDQQKLPQALKWEPKTGYERFYAVFSKTPLQVSEIRKALDQLKTSGKSVEQTSRLPLPYPQASTIIYRKAP